MIPNHINWTAIVSSDIPISVIILLLNSVIWLLDDFLFSFYLKAWFKCEMFLVN